jgi:TolB-like protein
VIPHLQRLSVLLAELKRRQVFRGAAVYAVAGWVLVEVTATVLPVFPVPDPDAVIRLLVGLVVLGFPIVLVLAWVFDLTAQGVRRTGVDRTSPAPVLDFLQSPAFQGTLVFLVLLVTSGAALVSWNLWLRPGATAAPPAESGRGSLDSRRLAVLYFDDFSPRGELGYLANGMTEALIHELSQVEALEVVSRNGVKPYRDLDFPLDSLARILGVGSIVEGSVEERGDGFVVTIQLVDGASASHLFSGRLEGRGEDVLALRDSIVEVAVRSLSQALGRELRRRKDREEAGHPRAWELFQRHHRLREAADTLRWVRKDTLAAGRLLRQADSLLARAADLDRNWIRPMVARGWLSRSRAGLFSVAQSHRAPELLREGIGFAEEALARSPGHPAALELRGTLRADLARAGQDEDVAALQDQAMGDLDAALDADSDRVMAWIYRADLLRIRGRFQEAAVAAERALEADPFLVNAEMEVLFTLSQVWLDLGELERAERFIDAGRSRFPGEPSFTAAKLVLLAGGVPVPNAADTALALVRQVEASYGMTEWSTGRLQMAAVLAAGGEPDSARALLAEVTTESPDQPWLRYYSAKVRLNLEEEDRAMDLLESFLDALPRRRAYIARDWWWEPLRSHPRFQALVQEDSPA